MIKLLIVDDSAVACELLKHIFQSDAQIQVIGIAHNGEEALAAIATQRPDVITMDIHMPKMNGIETIRNIISTQSIPIIVISASANLDKNLATFDALEAGAVAIAKKPSNIKSPNFTTQAKELIQLVKLISEIKIVRRYWAPLKKSEDISLQPQHAEQVMLVAIGASIGGPAVLETILAKLPKKVPPIVIVQHITAGFLPSLVQWLTQSTHLPIHIATNKELLQAGHVYLAPDGFQMGIDSDKKITLSKDKVKNGPQPSISFLFRSVEKVFGNQVIGVLLTGMGSDGVDELKRMKDQGAMTLVQNKESCVVYGMPGEAVARGAATYILSPEMIAEAIIDLIKRD
jgi:two-component system chemotaxis response regulator CheB